MKLKSLFSVNKFDVIFLLKNIGYPLICLKVILIILKADYNVYSICINGPVPLIKGC